MSNNISAIFNFFRKSFLAFMLVFAIPALPAQDLASTKKELSTPSVFQTPSRRLPSVLDNRLVVAFYGSPKAMKMGILGEQPLEQTAKILQKTMKEWAEVNNSQDVLGAFHLIYATVHPNASVSFLSHHIVKSYIDYAQAHGLLVVLDHQIGKHSIETVMNSLLPWLQYQNVHLAIDPEWKTLKPGIEIGTISAQELNKAQQMMEDHMVKEGLQERRMLIIHQFKAKMITKVHDVRSNFQYIDLVHHADGIGSPELKRKSYAYISSATNIPIKGFKLFLPKSWKKRGFDFPLMSPQEVLGLKPRPFYISIQ